MFDGRQHDASEFLLKDFQNLQAMSFGSWETRSPVPEGIIVDEEGVAPIHIDSTISSTVQQMLDNRTGKPKVHALLQDTPIVCVALPRFADRTKVHERIALAETISLPDSAATTPGLSTTHTLSGRSSCILAPKPPQATTEP